MCLDEYCMLSESEFLELDHLFNTPELLNYHNNDCFKRIVNPRLNIFTNVRTDTLVKHDEGIFYFYFFVNFMIKIKYLFF